MIYLKNNRLRVLSPGQAFRGETYIIFPNAFKPQLLKLP